MTITVQMLEDAFGGTLGLLSKGTTQALPDALANDLVAARRATLSSPRPTDAPINALTAAEKAWVQSSVSGGGITLAAIGDSLTDNNYTNTGVLQAYASIGYLTWAQMLLGQRLTLVNEGGVGGNTAADVQARRSVGRLARGRRRRRRAGQSVGSSAGGGRAGAAALVSRCSPRTAARAHG